MSFAEECTANCGFMYTNGMVQSTFSEDIGIYGYAQQGFKHLIEESTKTEDDGIIFKINSLGIL